MFKDVMLDLETLGNGENKCVCQIGACYFDRDTGAIGDTFKVNVDATDAVKEGFVLDAKTVYWWLAQSQAARESILAEPKISIRQAFNELNDFLKDAKCIWSHATFDFVTIMETYHKLGIKPSFPYKSGLDIRTLIEIAGGSSVDKTPRTNLHHDGLEDSIHQVKYCMVAFNRLKELKLAAQLIGHVKGKKYE